MPTLIRVVVTVPSRVESQIKPYHHGDLYRSLMDRAAEVIQSKGIEALTLRGLARDLGVSHGAPNRHFKSRADLLSALAADAYERVTRATLLAAERAGSDPWIRLNAMGRGFLNWAMENPAYFRIITHPDLEQYMDKALLHAVEEFREAVRDAVAAAQQDGRNSREDLEVLTLFTTAVPFGAAILMSQPAFRSAHFSGDRQELIADVIELVVPIRNRHP